MPTDLVLTLAIALGAALALGLVARQIRLSPIVGYLVAGIVVGPYTPGPVADHALAEQLAELGVVVLMFGVGLHFRVRDLLAARRIALPGAVVQVVAAVAMGAAICAASGWSVAAGVVFGGALSVAGTVLLTHVLGEHDALHTPIGRIAVGWTLVEDLLTVLALVLLPVLAGSSDASASGIAIALAIAAVKVAGLIAFTAVAGRRLIPSLLARVARLRSRELFTLSVLALALGIAVGSSYVFGASMALGAFLAGMVVAQSKASARAASEALPMRDAFAVLFFVSVGMLFDPAAVVENLGLTLAAIAVVVIGKPVVAYAVVRAVGRPRAVALPVAAALAQIGEFSFVLVALGAGLGILPAAAQQVIVVTAIASIAIEPRLFRWAIGRSPVLREAAGGRVVVVGHGTTGRAVVGELLRGGLAPTVIELDLRVAKELQREGVRALHGDASEREVLERAGIEGAACVLVATSGARADAVRGAVRALFPDVRLIEIERGAPREELARALAQQALRHVEASAGDGGVVAPLGRPRPA